jgi:hypothetical protein
MPRFVPVTDVEKPRSEQSSNDPDYSKHRKFDSSVQGIRRESSEKNKFEKSEKKKLPLRYEDMDPFERRKAMKEAKAKGIDSEDLNKEKADNYGGRDHDRHTDRESKDRDNDRSRDINQNKNRDNNNRYSDRDKDRGNFDRDRNRDSDRDSNRNRVRESDRDRDERNYERNYRDKDERTDRDNNRYDRKDRSRDEKDERRPEDRKEDRDSYDRSFNRDKSKVEDLKRERDIDQEGGLKELGVGEMNNLRQKIGLRPLSNENQNDADNQWARNEDVQYKRKKVD